MDIVRDSTDWEYRPGVNRCRFRTLTGNRQLVFVTADGREAAREEIIGGEDEQVAADRLVRKATKVLQADPLSRRPQLVD